MPIATRLHFEVSWDDSQNTSAFSEVSGLSMEAEVIEYHDGNDPSLTTMKIPGLKTYGNVTLKRGISPAEAGNGLNSASVARRSVTVTLLNETRDAVMSWEMKEVWPVKIEGPGLNATGNEIAIETIEFAHQGVVVIIAA